MTANDKHLYEFGAFRLDTREHLLLHNGERVRLEGKVFETLVALVQHSGRLVRKDELMNQVWPDAIVEENNLEKSISVLRKALGEHGPDFRYVETVRGLGYRFTADVRELDEDRSTLVKHESRTSVTIEDEEIDLREPASTDTSLAVKPQSEIKLISQRPGFINRINLRRRLLLGIAVIAIVAGVSTAYYFANRQTTTINSIAVMPFVNVGNDPNTEYLSEGITESLINSLSQLPNIKMIARTSVF